MKLKETYPIAHGTALKNQNLARLAMAKTAAGRFPKGLAFYPLRNTEPFHIVA